MIRLFAHQRALALPDGDGSAAPETRPEPSVPRAARPYPVSPGQSPGILNALRALPHHDRDGERSPSLHSSADFHRLSEQLTQTAGLIQGATVARYQPKPSERILDSGRFQAGGEQGFRVLGHRLAQLREQRSLQALLITSPSAGDGKTTVAVNLASTLARTSRSVVLVDANLRRADSSALGIPPAAGLSDYLLGQVDLHHIVQRVEPLGFYHVPAGLIRENPSELLQRHALREIAVRLAAEFDWVVFDSPAVNPFADALYLAMNVDAVLVVIRQGVTPKPAVTQCLTALDKAFVAGLVFNASTHVPYAAETANR